MIEEFKLYKITNNRRHGTIYWYVSNFGNVKKNDENFELKDKYNYYRFGTNNIVHRAVVELFIGPIPKGYQVDHIDGNRHNNHVNNLRIVTHEENMNNPITKNRISNTRTGKSNGPFSDEARKHMSEAHKNKQSWMKDKHHTDETKQKTSAKLKGRKCFYHEDGTRYYKFI